MMLTGKLAPFTGKGKLLIWRADYHTGRGPVLVMMTVQDATHAARSGVSLELVKPKLY